MAKFITRVELHGAGPADYEHLHAYMEAEKFRRFIAGDDRKIYALPTAEYESHGEITPDTVRRLAAGAAAKTGKRFWILVVQYTAAAWTLRKRQ